MLKSLPFLAPQALLVLACGRSSFAWGSEILPSQAIFWQSRGIFHQEAGNLKGIWGKGWSLVSILLCDVGKLSDLSDPGGGKERR